MEFACTCCNSVGFIQVLRFPLQSKDMQVRWIEYSKLAVCVCVCVCVCVRVYEDTNLYNDMGMTEVLQFEGGL